MNEQTLLHRSAALAQEPPSAVDHELFARLAQGGRAAELAIGAVYDEYAPRFRAFLRMRNLPTEQVEDLVQDVFLRVIESRERVAEVESPRAYLWCTLRNALIDQARRAGRYKRRFAEPPRLVTEEGEEASFEGWIEGLLATDGHELERVDHYECVGRALERYRRQEPERATAIELVAIEGFEGRELATVLGRSHGAAREFLSQARKALRALVQALCGGLYG
jgi:RNA polymerase sigma-70 factor (ECF subfamily)